MINKKSFILKNYKGDILRIGRLNIDIFYLMDIKYLIKHWNYIVLIEPYSLNYLFFRIKKL